MNYNQSLGAEERKYVRETTQALVAEEAKRLLTQGELVNFSEDHIQPKLNDFATKAHLCARMTVYACRRVLS